jgi:hypothetical protein
MQNFSDVKIKDAELIPINDLKHLLLNASFDYSLIDITKFNIPIILPKETNMSMNWFITIAVKILSPIVSLLTAEIKGELHGFIKNLYEKALKTDNVFDDFFIKLLADVLQIKVTD